MKRRTFSLYILMICCGMVRQKLRALPSVFPFRIPISFHTALYVIHQCETSFQNIGIGLWKSPVYQGSAISRGWSEKSRRR